MPAKKKRTTKTKKTKTVKKTTAKVSKSKKKTTKKPAAKKVAKKKVVKKPATKKAVKKATKKAPAKKKAATKKKPVVKNSTVIRRTITKKEALERAEVLTSIIESSKDELKNLEKKASKNKESKLNLRVADEAPLSPFTIYLTRDLPTPSVLLEEQEHSVPEVNFLNSLDWVMHTTPSEDPMEGMLVDEKVLSGQIQEKDFTEIVEPLWFSKPKMPKMEELDLSRFHTPEPVAEIPHETPVDIFDLLDLPEEEESDVRVNGIDPVVQGALEREELPEFVLGSEGPVIVEPDEEPIKAAKQPARPTKQPQQWRFPIGLRLEHGWHKAIAGFVLLSFVFVLPLHAMGTFRNLSETKTTLENTGHAALNNLTSGASAAAGADFDGAADQFASASEEFAKAQSTLRDMGMAINTLSGLIPETRSKAELLRAGDSLSRAATRLADAFAVMQTEISNTPVAKIKILETALNRALPYLEEASDHLYGVNPDKLPDDIVPAYYELTSALPQLTTSLNEFLSFSELAKEIMGEEDKKRYLVIFQNNNELRPTGGFIGSYALLDIYNGEIEDVYIPAGGSYDLQGSNQEFLAAPEPLQLINARWEFQDANWFPDFPSSAKKLIEFHDNSGGPSVDGVISLNASYMADLIGLLGPVEMDEYGRTINSENFIFETQKIVETEADKTAPKQFIADLAPVLLERIKSQNTDTFLKILSHLGTGLANKDIQLYFTDHELEEQVQELGWAGEVKREAGDYLMLVTTNLGGGKTDSIITEEVDIQVDFATDGTITNTVTITRTHNGLVNELFTGVNNVDYARLYVPRGSELIAASGFEIPEPYLFERPQPFFSEDEDLSFTASSAYTDPASGTTVSEEFGKTVFGNWIQTKPGETEVASFTYRLPWKVATLSNNYDLVQKIKDLVGLHPIDSYNLFIQKQSGVIDRSYNVEVDLDPRLNIIWSTNEDYAEQNVTISAKNNNEVYLGIVFERDL